MSRATMVYDPEDDRGLPFVRCGVQGCSWHWINVRDLNNVTAVWRQHVAQTHTFEAELADARRETEALRLETEALREQLRRAGLPT